MSFSGADFAALDARLAAAADEKYRKFNESLIPGKQNTTYGVRIPALRAEAKALCRSDWRGFLDCEAVQSSAVHEVVTLCGIVTASAKCTEAERMERTARFIPRIDNWAVNDTACASYRIPAAKKEAWKAFLAPYLTSGQEFAERFALILLMDQFLADESNTAFVLDACTKARCPGYYAKMAVAWTLCTAFCKQRSLTLDYLTKGDGQTLDGWVLDKAVQKCRESYRVSAKDKAMLTEWNRSRSPH